jgi:hypothetical protein
MLSLPLEFYVIGYRPVPKNFTFSPIIFWHPSTKFCSGSSRGKRWDVQLFLVRLMFCSTRIMFDNKKIGRF